MKKIAKLLTEHIGGHRTDESEKFFKKISLKLEKSGFKLPLNRIRISKIKKTAGVSFVISGSEDEKPQKISNICYTILDFFSKNGQSFSYDQIAPDGDDYDKMIGTINIYPVDNEQAEIAKNIMSDFINRASKILTITNQREENHEGEDRIRVIRYDVVENKTSQIEEAPEMHLSNDNAKKLLDLLAKNGLVNFQDFEEGSTGEFSATILKLILEKIEHNPKQVKEYTRETEEGSNYYNNGLTEEQMWYYLNQLSDMIDFAKQNGYTYITYY